MACRLVAELKRAVLDAEAQPEHSGLEPGVPALRTSLITGSLEVADPDANRDTCATGVAVGTVGEDAAAPESESHQLAVEVVAYEMRRCGDLRARHPARQIAAGVGRSHVELQYRMR